MADVESRTEDWRTLPWKDIQRNVFRLQKRIYRAARQGDIKRVHNLQRLLLRSWSARCLAVRRVTQDNRGKRTPGVDGVASLTSRQRLQMARDLQDLSRPPSPIRRTHVEKPGKAEKRPLGIPVMFDRAAQTLVRMALEPEWEARFEPNSYGFRPGRSAHDAIESIFNFIRLKPKYTLDADIRKCFDRISHQTLLDKLHTIQLIERLVRGWLKAGILDHGEYIFPEAGVPQGSPLSPLLANLALHGLETALREAAPSKSPPGVIRYADDFVALHADLDVLKHLQEVATEWLAERFPDEKHDARDRAAATIRASAPFRRGRLLAALGLSAEAEDELDSLRRSLERDPSTLLAFAESAWRAGVTRSGMRAITVLRAKAGLPILSGETPAAVARLLYPIDHLESVLHWQQGR